MDSHLTADHSFFEMLAESDRIYKANTSFPILVARQGEAASGGLRCSSDSPVGLGTNLTEEPPNEMINLRR